MSVPEMVPATAQTPAEQSVVKSAPTAVPESDNTVTSAHLGETTETTAGTEPVTVSDSKITSAQPTNKGEGLVEATPALEGVLGYKAPGIFR